MPPLEQRWFPLRHVHRVASDAPTEPTSIQAITVSLVFAADEVPEASGQRSFLMTISVSYDVSLPSIPVPEYPKIGGGIAIVAAHGRIEPKCQGDPVGETRSLPLAEL